MGDLIFNAQFLSPLSSPNKRMCEIAQMVKRKTVEWEILGSNPEGDDFFN